MTSLSLEEAAQRGHACCGAKAARLAAARSVGAEILPGRVLTIGALAELFGKPDPARWRAAVAPAADPAARRHRRRAFVDVADSVRWQVDAGSTVSEIRGMLRGSVEPLEGLIVRSSATVEDGQRYAWAGIFDSVFCPFDDDAALAEAIRRVWASQWSMTAHLYATRTGQALDGERMAVLIQPVCVPDIGGVAFSVDPRAADGNRRVAEVTWGLPKAVVDADGAVDRVTFSRGGTILEAEVADKATRLVLSEGRPTAASVLPSMRRQPCLGAQDVRRIDRLLSTLEAHFGAPQDIEWGIIDERLILFQTRPQTAGVRGPGATDLKGDDPHGRPER